ncbi:hypothetical protein ACIO14_30760 [Nocardia fluminea]|uniref:hypothetical protein n=1 Tax=Nocardia fluminea TaxID=134984 RepID=UPI0038292CBE
MTTLNGNTALAFALDGCGTVLVELADALEPHRLAVYLYELARASLEQPAGQWCRARGT